jgi:hypothetical protein
MTRLISVLQDRYFIDVRGSANKTVQEFYEEQGGPEAYLGSTLPGFPNFMLIQGAFARMMV